MIRIALFLATNAAILVLISIVFKMFGFEGILAENGVDLNLQALLVMSLHSWANLIEPSPMRIMAFKMPRKFKIPSRSLRPIIFEGASGTSLANGLRR